MLLLIDEDVPEDVAQLLKDRGHDVLYARLLTPSEPDTVVAKLASERRAVIVTFNTRDYRRLVSRRPLEADGPSGWVTNRGSFPHAGRITFYKCHQLKGLQRLRQTIEVIECEFNRLQTQTDKRLVVDVEEGHLRIY